MFKSLTDSIENTLDVALSIIDPDRPLTKKMVAKLIADGVSVAAIATAAGVGVEVVQELIDDE